MATCSLCGRQQAPPSYKLPSDIRREKSYCACIAYHTLKDCAMYSLLNAEQLAQDAEFLHKKRRYMSALALTVLSLEESGKSMMASEHLSGKADVTVEEYDRRFLNHSAKIQMVLRGLRVHPLVAESLEWHYEHLKTEAFYVNYDGQYRKWFAPWGKNIESLETGQLLALVYGKKARKTKRKFREAQEAILKIFSADLIDRTRLIVARLRNNELKRHLGILR